MLSRVFCPSCLRYGMRFWLVWLIQLDQVVVIFIVTLTAKQLVFQAFIGKCFLEFVFFAFWYAKLLDAFIRLLFLVSHNRPQRRTSAHRQWHLPPLLVLRPASHNRPSRALPTTHSLWQNDIAPCLETIWLQRLEETLGLRGASGGVPGHGEAIGGGLVASGLGVSYLIGGERVVRERARVDSDRKKSLPVH